MTVRDWPERGHVEQLYDQGLFVDAYHACAEVWQHPEWVRESAPHDLVLAGRLARRLGGEKVSRWLLREAFTKAPHDPRVRFFSRWTVRARGSLLDELRLVEKEPDLPDAEPGLRASWLASSAMTFAQVRDFDRAFELADLAQSLSAERAWVKTCRSTVFLLADRWQQALEEVEEGWALAAGMPAVVTTLGYALARCGRLEEAAERLSCAAAPGQSYEVVFAALHYCCAHAERLPRHDLKAWETRARGLTSLLPDSAPLADRSVTCLLDGARLDLALMLGDHDALLERPANHPALGFFQIVQNHVRSCPQGRRTVIDCQGVLQKHNTCLPSSVATVLSAWGEMIDADALAAQLTYGGTQVWRVSGWLKERGYVVRHAVFTRDLARQFIEASLPFVLMYTGEGYAHAVAAIGLDDAAGTLILHDPSLPRWRHILLDRVADQETPIGPEIMVVVPADFRETVAALLPDDEVEVLAARHEFDRVGEEEGVSTAARVVERLENHHPEHAHAKWLGARHDAMAGNLASALERYEALVKEFPQNIVFRQDLLIAYYRTGSTASMRHALHEIVERRRLPGIEASQDWIYPPPHYVARYADLISMSAEHAPYARRLLERALIRAPHCGEAYHILADVLARSSRHEESVLPYRVASSLDEDDDHYARAASDAYRLAGREEDGLEFLRRRAERLSRLERGLSAWSTYVDALEDYGHPRRAGDILHATLKENDHPVVLLAYACGFWVRRGRWNEAGQIIERLSTSTHRLEYQRVAALYHDAQGDWRKAWPFAEHWLEETPFDMDARRLLLELMAKREGRAAALDAARSWLTAHPGHDELELLVLEQLDAVGRRSEALLLVQERLARNAEDAWAWREQGYRCTGQLDQLPAGDEECARLESALAVAMDGCARTCPGDPATLSLRARALEIQGQTTDAIALYLDALYADPDYPYAYGRVRALLPQVERAEQERCLDALEQALLRSVGPLRIARALVPSLARYHGFEHALNRIECWRERRGRDPELVVAHAEVLQKFGAGRPDAERAVEVLRQGIANFPAHHSLRSALAKALSELVLEDEAGKAWQDILQRVPSSNQARFELANLFEDQGREEESEKLLRQAMDTDPMDDQARLHLAHHLWMHAQPLEAIDVLRGGVAHMPEDMDLLESLVQRLLDLGQCEEAVQAAREGVESHPIEAYAWYLLGHALTRSPQHTAAREAEQALRMALKFNAQLFDAADDLAVFHTRSKRFNEARDAILSICDRMDDPSPARGRLAWITREEGKRVEARAALHDVLRSAPWYAWGWYYFMSWLQEDKAWDQARETLERWPDALRDAGTLRALRLEVLEEAGTQTELLDTEWTALLGDFPRNLEMALRRFDHLWDLQRFDEAAGVLASCERFHAGDRHLLARKVVVYGREERHSETLDAAMSVWLQPDRADWPDETAWNAVARSGQGRKARQRLFNALKDDYRVSPSAFERATWDVAGIQSETQHRQRAWLTCRLQLRPAIWKLRRLLRVLDACSWDTSLHRSLVIRTLVSMGYGRLVLNLWKSHREQWDPETVVWQEVCQAASQVSRRKARALLADWQSRPGVEMYAVGMYTIALRGRGVEGSRKDRLADIMDASYAALDQVANDWTVRYLACVYCESALRLRRYEDFMAGMEAYKSYIDPAADHEDMYMRDSYRAIPQVLQKFHELMSQGDGGVALDVRELHRALAATSSRNRLPAWVLTEWYHCQCLVADRRPSRWKVFLLRLGR